MIKHHSSGFLNLVNDTKSRVNEINVDDLAEKIKSNVTFYLIDVREQDEYNLGFIPGAIHLSKGIIERDIEVQFPDYTADIIVYCSGGFRSCLVADNLNRMGYQRVSSLVGGFKAWLRANLLT